MISIILPTFDRLDYLREAIGSIFAQTLADWELLVADDGSGPATRAYLTDLPPEAPRAQRIETIWLPHTGKPGVARNAALRAARGEHVAFLDSDDLWAPRKLEAQVAALRARPECQWCYTAFTRVDASGAIVPDERHRRWDPYAGAIFEAIVRGQAQIRTPAVMAARGLVMDAGGFDETLPAAEDYDLWARLALRSPVAVVDEPLVSVRMHDQNLTRDWALAFAGRERSLRKLQGLVDPSRRSLVRRERALNAAALAARHAAGGDGRAAWAALGESRSYGWRQAAWWRQVARSVLGRRVLGR